MTRTVFMMLTVLMITAGGNFAQTLKSGSLAALKEAGIINARFDFTGARVGGFDDQEKYIADKKAKYNNSKPGSGDQWEVKWRETQKDIFPSDFVTRFNEKSVDCGFTLKQGANDARYTLVIRTTSLDQGIEIAGYVTRPANIDLVMTLVETATPEVTVAMVDAPRNYSSSKRVEVEGVSVSKESYDIGLRIAEAYRDAGKRLAKWFCRQFN